MEKQKKTEGRITAVGYTITPEGSIEFHGEVEPGVKRKILKERQEALTRDGKKRELWGPIGPDAMTRLAKMFPSLREAAGIEPWDAITFLEWLCTSGAVTSGSFWAGLFILGVWNDMDWSEAASELAPHACRRCDGHGRVDREGEAVRKGRRDGEFVHSQYDDDGNRLADVTVATFRCETCNGKGAYQPTLKTARFSVFQALGVWDREHKLAFETWIKYSFYP